MNREFDTNYEFRSRSLRNEVNEILDEHFVSLACFDVDREYTEFLHERTSGIVTARIPRLTDPRSEDIRLDLFNRITHMLENNETTLWLTREDMNCTASSVNCSLFERFYGLPFIAMPREDINLLNNIFTQTRTMIEVFAYRVDEDYDRWRHWLQRYDRIIGEIHEAQSSKKSQSIDSGHG